MMQTQLKDLVLEASGKLLEALQDAVEEALGLTGEALDSTGQA